MRAIWTGAIGFGLVNIPIKIYSATTDSRPDFDLLDRKDHARVRYKRVNEDTGKEVDWDQIVKGHRWKGDYVVLEEADFEEAAPEKTKMIALHSFVQEEEIEAIYFQNPYFLQPQKGSEKVYTLLRRALTDTGMAGLSTFVLRQAEQLAIIRPYEGVLLLHTLRFKEEIRPVADYQVPDKKVAKEELNMAVQLIKQHAAEFDIAKFRDDYSRQLMKIIRAKAQGKRPAIRKLKPRKKAGDNLLDQLKASLA